MSMPMVMREGKAWGLMIRSGRMPVLQQYGMSTSGQLQESMERDTNRKQSQALMRRLYALGLHTLLAAMQYVHAELAAGGENGNTRGKYRYKTDEHSSQTLKYTCDASAELD